MKACQISPNPYYCIAVNSLECFTGDNSRASRFSVSVLWANHTVFIIPAGTEHSDTRTPLNLLRDHYALSTKLPYVSVSRVFGVKYRARGKVQFLDLAMVTETQHISKVVGSAGWPSVTVCFAHEVAQTRML